MLRPTRSRLVTEIDIVPAFRWCNLIKEKSFSVQNMGISGFARPEAAGGWLTLRPSQVCEDDRLSWGMLPAIGAALVAPPNQAADCDGNTRHLGICPVVFAFAGK